jgi:hypothetical protein
MAHKRNDCPATSSAYLSDDPKESLIQRFLDAPGIGWLALRILVVFGPLAAVSVLLLSAE